MCLVHSSVCWCEPKMACCNPPLQRSGRRDGTCQHREGAVSVSCPLRGSMLPSHHQTEAVAVLSVPLLWTRGSGSRAALPHIPVQPVFSRPLLQQPS